MQQGITKLEDMFKRHGKAVDDLKEIAKVFLSLACQLRYKHPYLGYSVTLCTFYRSWAMFLRAITSDS